MLRSEHALVTMADVDAAGIIYFATPLRWAERMSTGWLNEIGHSLTSMFAAGVTIPAVAVQVEYRSQLTLDDQVRLELSAEAVGTTSFTLRCEGFVGDAATAAVCSRTTHVYTRFTNPALGGEGAAKEPVPDWLRTALTADLPACR
ncbi:MAG TPA: thioesterase family protein [Pseudonocardiaceae bacterium]|jgi:YbgC/YbaW family acyl-CoA thioester hydrolase|nr:thioesterase family protein [Pseudonocardiaceae bacterium]